MNVVHFLTFQLLWFGAVFGAAEGWQWAGPLALVPHLALHLALVPGGERRREVRALGVVGLAGVAMDTALHHAGLTSYPGSSTPLGLVPLWIAALWVGLASLPRFSLSWLKGRPVAAVVFGAVGGPLSFWAGARAGAVALSDPPIWTTLALAAQYAVVFPLLLARMPGESPRARAARFALADR